MTWTEKIPSGMPDRQPSPRLETSEETSARREAEAARLPQFEVELLKELVQTQKEHTVLLHQILQALRQRE